MYLPHREMQQNRMPDKKFFWAVVFTCLPQWCRRYHNLVLDQRAKQAKKDVNAKHLVKVTDEWMKKLLQFDHKSRGKCIMMLDIYI